MIRVNGNEYVASAVFATDGSMSMTFETNDTLEAIEAAFPLECIIEVTEKGETVAKYYNKKVLSLKVEIGLNRKVTVVFAVSEIQQSAEDKLNDRADTSDGAIEELAGLVAGQMEVTEALDDRTTSLEETTAKFEERIAKLEQAATAPSTGNDKTTADTATEVSNG